jgi:hypothetical protein
MSFRAWAHHYAIEKKRLDEQGTSRTVRDSILKSWTLGYVSALREVARYGEWEAADIMCTLNGKGKEPE